MFRCCLRYTKVKECYKDFVSLEFILDFECNQFEQWLFDSDNGIEKHVYIALNFRWTMIECVKWPVLREISLLNHHRNASDNAMNRR